MRRREFLTTAAASTFIPKPIPRLRGHGIGRLNEKPIEKPASPRMLQELQNDGLCKVVVVPTYTPRSQILTGYAVYVRRS